MALLVQERTATLGSVMQQAKGAFGSLISVDGAFTAFQSPKSVQRGAVQGVQDISDNHHFLVSHQALTTFDRVSPPLGGV